MGNGAAERRMFFRSNHIGMDPLVIIGDIGEAVNPLLIDREPFTDQRDLIHLRRQLLEHFLRIGAHLFRPRLIAILGLGTDAELGLIQYPTEPLVVAGILMLLRLKPLPPVLLRPQMEF